MGSSFSEPIPHDPGLGYVGISLMNPNKIRAIHAPHEVLQLIFRVIKEVNAAAGYSQEINHKYKRGVIQISLEAYCFGLGSSKTDATYGKLFCIRMFEEMYRIGYDVVASSDMARSYDQSTLIFVKNSAERPRSKIVCVAPGKSNILILLNADEFFLSTVKGAISEAWPKGIMHEEVLNSCGQSLLEMTLHGSAFKDYAGADNVHCRRMMINIIGKLGAIHYKLLVGTNIKGGTDSLFFMYDANYRVSPEDLCIISLNKVDRIRLVNCGEMTGFVRAALNANDSPPEREMDKYGSWEFKLEGCPWNCSGKKAIKTRRLISRISEIMLEQGWALTDAIDVSRSEDDKSVLLYTRASPLKTTFACIALSSIDTIRIIDFPPHEAAVFKEIMERKFLPGIEEESHRDDSCWELKLNGCPWSGGSYGDYARSVLMYVIKMASSMGWRFIASADVSSKYIHQKNGPDYPEDVHSLYFVHLPWTKIDQNSVGGETHILSGSETGGKFEPPSYNDAIQS